MFRIEWNKVRPSCAVDSPPSLSVVGRAENVMTETDAAFSLRHDTIGREEPGERR